MRDNAYFVASIWALISIEFKDIPLCFIYGNQEGVVRCSLMYFLVYSFSFVDFWSTHLYLFLFQVKFLVSVKEKRNGEEDGTVAPLLILEKFSITLTIFRYTEFSKAQLCRCKVSYKENLWFIRCKSKC